MVTQAIQDYLKAIFKLEEAEGATTKGLADLLDVKPASVSGMLKKLGELNLIRYEPYRGVELTEAGRKIALETIRHHRLIELFLAEALDMPWDKVHAEAERLEHVISEELEERMADILGNPQYDPHGDPIPTRQGDLPHRELIPLTQLTEGNTAAIAQVSDHDPELLRYLGERGLYPGTSIKLIRVEPFAGPLTISVDGDERVLGRSVAEFIQVLAAPEPAVDGKG